MNMAGIEGKPSRLIDYLCIVGIEKDALDAENLGEDEGRFPEVGSDGDFGLESSLDTVAFHQPQLLKRYPPEDHKDFQLPWTVVNFCQPDGCKVLELKKGRPKDTSSFAFTLTDKDSGKTRYGVSCNFYRLLKEESAPTNLEKEDQFDDETKKAFQSWGSDGQNCGKTSSDSAFSSDYKKADSECEDFSFHQKVVLKSSAYSSSHAMPGSVGSTTTRPSEPKVLLSNVEETRRRLGNGPPASSGDVKAAKDGSARKRAHHYMRHKAAASTLPMVTVLSDDSDTVEVVYYSASSKNNRRVRQSKVKARYYGLTSLCFISHFQFFSKFRECLDVLRQLIDAIVVSSKGRCCCGGKCGLSPNSTNGTKKGHSKKRKPLSSWDVLLHGEGLFESFLKDGCGVGDIRMPCPLQNLWKVEAWIHNLLSISSPCPAGQVKLEVELLPNRLLPTTNRWHSLVFALPDSSRFSFCDFPIHLPLELLGIETFIQVLVLLMTEKKIVMQSQDYSALTFSVLALTRLIHPLEYVFPVIPLLPSSMSGSEQLLLSPTPFLIGVTTEFWRMKRLKSLPSDIWLVDVDSGAISPPAAEFGGAKRVKVAGSGQQSPAAGVLPSIPGVVVPFDLPALPEAELKVLRHHLKQVLDSMAIRPIKNLEDLSAESLARVLENLKPAAATAAPAGPNGVSGVVPLIFGNDDDSIDVATRVCMAYFMMSASMLDSFEEHVRLIRLYPRPIVAFKTSSFVESRPTDSAFIRQLAATQAVQCLAEWTVAPTNVAYQRVQDGVYDPAMIGDKAKWFEHSLRTTKVSLWNENVSFAGFTAAFNRSGAEDDEATDESGEDSEAASSTSSSTSTSSSASTSPNHSSCSSFSDYAVSGAPVDRPVDSAGQQSPPGHRSERRPRPRRTDGRNLLVHQYQSLVDDSGGGGEGCDPRVQGDNGGAMGASPEAQDDGGPAIEDGAAGPDSPSDGYDVFSSVAQQEQLSDEDSQATTVEGTTASLDQLPPSQPPPPLPDSPEPELEVAGVRSKANPPPVPPRRDLAQLAKEGSSSVAPSPPASPASTTRSQRCAGVLSADRGCHRIDAGNRPAPLDSHPCHWKPEDAGLTVRGVGAPHLLRFHPVQHSLRFSTTESVSSAPGSIGASYRRISSDFSSLPPVPATTAASSNGGGAVAGCKWPLVTAASGKPVLTRTSSNMSNSSGFSLTTTHDLFLSISSDLGGLVASSTSSSNVFEDLFGSDPQGIRRCSGPAGGDQHHHRLRRNRLGSNCSGGNNGGSAFARGGPSSNNGSRPPSAGSANLPSSRRTSVDIQMRRDHSVYRENKAFVVDVVHKLLLGEGIGWLKVGRLKRLMEDECCRLVSLRQLRRNINNFKQLHCNHVPDVQVDRGVWKGVVKLAQVIVGGTGASVVANDKEGFGSFFQLLELLHTHYTLVAPTPSSRPGTPSKAAALNPAAAADMAHLALVPSCDKCPDVEVPEEAPDDTAGGDPASRRAEGGQGHQGQGGTDLAGGEVVVAAEPAQPPPPLTRKSRRSGSCRFAAGKLHRPEATTEPERTYLYENFTSAVSPASSSSGTFSGRRASMMLGMGLGSSLGPAFVQNVQFWEDCFYDAVSEERSALGIDLDLKGLKARYDSVSLAEKRAFEEEEDKLLSTMIYNLTAFMVMMQVPRPDIVKKVRRLVAKCHISISGCEDIYALLDNIKHVSGNDVDLKVIPTRAKRFHSFAVTKATGDHRPPEEWDDTVVLEVRDAGLVFRKTGAGYPSLGSGGSSTIGSLPDDQVDQCPYEAIVNMTYSPKNRIICLWRKVDGMTSLEKFYSRRSKDLYYCIKRAMEKAAEKAPGPLAGCSSSTSSSGAGSDLAGEFPVEDLLSGEGGLLQVCMEGVGVLFADRKVFLRLENIRKCYTLKGGVFILEEFSPASRRIVTHRFGSYMADQICYSVLCVFSVLAAAQRILE